MKDHPDEMPELPPSLASVTMSAIECLEPTADACVRYLKVLEGGGMDSTLIHHLVFVYQQMLLNHIGSLMGEARQREAMKEQGPSPAFAFNPGAGFFALVNGFPGAPEESSGSSTGDTLVEDEPPPLGDLSELPTPDENEEEDQ